jgi:asparagine synthase (glutamine-hydrolysing)
MSGLCGSISDAPEEIARAILADMLVAGGPAVQSSQSRFAGGAGIAVYGTTSPVQVLADDGFLLAFVGHPRLRDAGRDRDAPFQLARALRARGRAALADIGGDFALAAWDATARRGFVAIDRFGVHQVVYGHHAEGISFASTLDMLGGDRRIRRELSNQGLYDYLFYHVSPGPATVFADVMRIPAGHCIEFGPGAGREPSAYWTLRYTEDDPRNLDALKEEFVAVLQAAVADAAAGGRCGAFLSGGTDSSTVSGMLMRAGEPAQTFSIGFDVAGYDEMVYARIAARHFGCVHHEYYVTPADVVDAVPDIAAAYDQPFGNASAVPTYYCARLARRHDVSRLLAGDGGDELFGGNERYAKQQLLGLYAHLPPAVRSALIEPLLDAVPSMRRLPLVRKIHSYVEQARPPMPLRYATYNLLMHFGHENVFTPEFLDAVNTAHPHAMMAEAHAPHAGASLVNQMQAVDLRFVLADGDLPKVTRMCELAGVDVAFPMLDERVLEFSLGLPGHLKLRGTTLRWFFKQALRDFLPREVIAKRKHGFGLPVGAWLVGHPPLLDLAVTAIGPLKRRGIVQAGFIDSLLAARLREHPAYYGTMVWVLMMLGLWLESRRL